MQAQGKTIVVTGSVTRIGAAPARRFGPPHGWDGQPPGLFATPETMIEQARQAATVHG